MYVYIYIRLSQKFLKTCKKLKFRLQIITKTTKFIPQNKDYNFNNYVRPTLLTLGEGKRHPGVFDNTQEF